MREAGPQDWAGRGQAVGQVGKSLWRLYDGYQGRNMKERIGVVPQIHFGKPCVSGTRIPVQNVLELVREEIPFAEIIRDYYPELKSEDIRARIRPSANGSSRLD